MRINSLVTAFINDNSDKIAFMSQLNGGWERWLQLELAYACHKELKTEMFYPNESKERFDIVIHDAVLPSNTSIKLEIKCQTINQKIAEFIAATIRDIEKMARARQPIYVLAFPQQSISIADLDNMSHQINAICHEAVLKYTSTTSDSMYPLKYLLIVELNMDNVTKIAAKLAPKEKPMHSPKNDEMDIEEETNNEKAR